MPFRKRRKIAEYTGERITNAEAERRAKRRRVLRMSGLDDRWSIDGARGGNGTHYINHSCNPNAFMQTVRGHLLVLALRDIAPGEEITVNYNGEPRSRKAVWFDVVEVRSPSGAKTP